MATNHRISSEIHDRYQGAVKANELRSRKHEHDNMHAKRNEDHPKREHDNMHAKRNEDRPKLELKLYDSFDKSFKVIHADSRPHQLRDKMIDHDHRHGKTDRYDRGRHSDKWDFGKHNVHHHGKGFSYGKRNHGLIEIDKNFQDIGKNVQLTKVTYNPSAALSGLHLGSRDKIADAHKSFISAALGYLENPNKDTYKALTESMTKLLDPRFTPAVKGGGVNVKVTNVNGTIMAKFTMEVTPAATKTLDEAREDLKNIFSSKRDGEKGIDKLREEAHANYIRALSEKFKDEGKINHTNHTPTTPVFKTSTIYVVKMTQINLSGLHELKKPDFNHNLKGKFNVKGHHDFRNSYRNNHKNYFDTLKHDHKKPQIDQGFKFIDNLKLKHHQNQSKKI